MFRAELLVAVLGRNSPLAGSCTSGSSPRHPDRAAEPERSHDALTNAALSTGALAATSRSSPHNFDNRAGHVFALRVQKRQNRLDGELAGCIEIMEISSRAIDFHPAALAYVEIIARQ
jgi:hypothetical protein